MSVSFSIVLDTRRLKKRTKTYPIKLMVTYQRVTRPYQTIHDLSKENYLKLKASNISVGLQKIRNDLNSIETEAGTAIKKINPFSFYEFKRDFIEGNPLFKQRKTKLSREEETPDTIDYSEYYKKFPILKEDHNEPGTISGVYCSYIKQLISEKRIGSALKYRDSYNSLKKFGGNMQFVNITVSWLRRYEIWMLEMGRSRATIGMVLRALRCIFNEADHQGIINKQKCYPFGRRKYLIPTSKKVKKALKGDDIAKIYYDKPTCENEEYAKALWFYCYYGNGMNPKDLAQLKFKNIDGDYLSFYRAKTELTLRNDPKLITVYINDDMHNIMSRWGNTDTNPENFIFPILQPGLDPLTEYFTVTRITHFINDWMKKIGKRLGIEIKPTTVVTRHSFSTVMKRSGVSTEFIQESLGHNDIRTTENYLDSFENEVRKEYAGKLIAFKNRPLNIEKAG